MVITRLIFLLLPLGLFASNFQDFVNSQNKGVQEEQIKFLDYKKAELKAYNKYQEETQEAVKNYKKEILTVWKKPELSSVKKIVNYSKDLHTKSVIDFDKNEITISTIRKNAKNVKESLIKTLNKTLDMSSKEVFKQNKLEQKIEKIATKSKFKRAKVDKIKLLKTKFDKKENVGKKVKVVKKGNVYKITYKLPKNSTYRRSFKYLVDAKANAIRFKVKPEVILAIMHSESSFNPMAKSHIPAYGLMQIVPKSAGIDSYAFLYKKRRLLSASYLYNSKKNIEIGSAYFHILYYRYLKSIKNPTSRLYCSIAGYNTGAGNVSWAFTKTFSPKKASKIINKMSSEQVYNYLLKNLKYDEPKHYLKRVRARSVKYKELYKF